MATKTLEETFSRYNLEWEPISELPTLLTTQQEILPGIKEHKVVLEVAIKRNVRFSKEILEQSIAGHKLQLDMITVAEAHLEKWTNEQITVQQQLDLALLKDQCTEFRGALEQILAYYDVMKVSPNGILRRKPKKKRR